jgi:hypothetical protein
VRILEILAHCCHRKLLKNGICYVTIVLADPAKSPGYAVAAVNKLHVIENMTSSVMCVCVYLDSPRTPSHPKITREGQHRFVNSWALRAI